MKVMKKTTSVDEYIDNADRWRAGLRELRRLLLASGLEESVKWGAPCYIRAGKNVVGLGAFKSYFGLWFYQGTLIPDPQGVLVNAQKGKTKALRQWRFTDESIDADAVSSYLEAAIELQDRGEFVAPERGRPIVIPPELEDALVGDSEAEAAFAVLSPGKRREYADHVADAKRADTKNSRIEKILPMIRSGVGLHDKFR